MDIPGLQHRRQTLEVARKNNLALSKNCLRAKAPILSAGTAAFSQQVM